MIYIPLLATILLQLVPSAHAYSKDIQTPFSGAKDAAAFLKEKNLDKKILVGYQAWTASSIIPYLQKDKKMFYSECSRYGSYYMYDSCFINKGYLISVEKAVDIAYDQFKGRLQDVVFVFNTPVNVRAMQYLDLVYESPEPVLIENEYYYIYRFKAGVK